MGSSGLNLACLCRSVAGVIGVTAARLRGNITCYSFLHARAFGIFRHDGLSFGKCR